MKTKLFTLLLTFVVIGLVIPSFAFSPDKDKGEKTTNANLTIPVPPPSYTVPITVLDPNATCGAQLYCTIRFEAHPADDDCVPYSSDIVGVVYYTPGTPNYNMTVTTSYSHVVIYPVIVGHCNYSVNSNYCCEDLNNITTCRLYVCP